MMNGGSSPDGFTFASLVVHLRALERVVLPPNSGSTFRGAFGHAFRNVECRRRGPQNCLQCFLQGQCLYYRYFLRANPGGRHPVRPYIFEVPYGRPIRVEPGEQVSFIFTLVGEGLEYLPVFLAVFEEMGNCGLGKGKSRCVLDSVYALGDEEHLPVYLKTSGERVLNPPIVRHWKQFADKTCGYAQRVQVQFLTPTRIQSKGRLIDDVPFHILVDKLLNRILDLDREYCGGTLDFPLAPLVRKAEEGVRRIEQKVVWYDWERYSSYQNSRMKLGGIVGYVTYEGEVAPFIPYLYLGEYIHIGKQSTFGNGTIKVEVL